MPVGRGYQEARPTLLVWDDGTRHGFRKKELSAVACGGEKIFGRTTADASRISGPKSKRLLFGLAVLPVHLGAS
jgi:hypothetical protein